MKCIAAILLMLALTACGAAPVVVAPTATPPTATPDPCSSEVLAAFGKDARPVLERYLRQVDLTKDMPRLSIGPAIQGLADRGETIISLQSPACLADWHERANAMAQYYQDGFAAFAAQRDGAPITLKRAGILRESVMTALETIEAGKVPELKPLAG